MTRAGEIGSGTISCSLCGHAFREDEAQTSCAGCPVRGGCRLVKCPNCGFETPPDPAWLKALLSRSRRSGPSPTDSRTKAERHGRKQ
jgi:hypothetical protein